MRKLNGVSFVVSYVSLGKLVEVAKIGSRPDTLSAMGVAIHLMDVLTKGDVHGRLMSSLKTGAVSYRDDKAWLEIVIGMWRPSLQMGDCWVACGD